MVQFLLVHPYGYLMKESNVFVLLDESSVLSDCFWPRKMTCIKCYVQLNSHFASNLNSLLTQTKYRVKDSTFSIDVHAPAPVLPIIYQETWDTYKPVQEDRSSTKHDSRTCSELDPSQHMGCYTFLGSLRRASSSNDVLCTPQMNGWTIWFEAIFWYNTHFSHNETTCLDYIKRAASPHQ